MGTRYFTDETLDFLEDLAVFNEREWFQANRDRYEDHVRTPMLELITDLREPVALRVSPHLVCDPRKQGGSMFRINRDTRFSADKSPYKTHVAAALRHEDSAQIHGAPSLYLQIAPGQCMLGAGVYRPPTDVLTAIRNQMVEDADSWVATRDAVVAAGWQPIGDSLKRAPKGFDPDHPIIEDLRRTTFAVMRPLTDRQVTGSKLLDLSVERWAQVAPYLGWLCGAMGVPF